MDVDKMKQILASLLFLPCVGKALSVGNYIIMLSSRFDFETQHVAE